MANLEIGELGRRLRFVDNMLVQVLAARHQLALQVGQLKLENGDPIYRPAVEQQRMDAAAAYGESLGLSRPYVLAMIYAAIREACMDQTIQRDAYKRIESSNVLPYDRQKANLLTLTARIAATYDDVYLRSPATKQYLSFEDSLLETLVQQLGRDERGRFIDLGCGTGAISLRAAHLFASVVGYDLSPEMIGVATAKWREKHAGTNVAFKVADLEDGIPEGDGSASFVAMSLGTASDMKSIETILKEVSRVLRPGGKFLLSFYNASALLYRWKYLPWQLSLGAHLNPDEHCLDVLCGSETFQVFARPYTTDEIRALFSGILPFDALQTYPTVSAVLPNEAFVGQPSEELMQTVEAIDRQLSFGHYGAYVVVTGSK